MIAIDSPMTNVTPWERHLSRLSAGVQGGYDPMVATVLLVGTGMLAGAGLWVFSESLPPFLGGCLAGSGGAWLVLVARAAVVRSKVHSQVPEVIDNLAAALRTGTSVERAFAAVAEKANGPFGLELRLGSLRIAMGLPADEVVSELALRHASFDLNCLAMAFAAHRQTGGELPAMLELLAQMSRERAIGRRQIRAATSTARLAAVIVGLTGPGLLAYYHFEGDGFFRLWSDESGRQLLIVAAALELIGAIWIALSTRMEE